MKLLSLVGGIGQALGHRDYRYYWAANSLYSTGRWMNRTAVGWLVWELTHSTSWLGIAAFSETFPMVLFTVLAGAVADRIGYLRVIRASQFAASCTAALFAATTLTGLIRVELIVVFVALLGSFDALSTPARMSLIHSLVPGRDLAPAIALGSATFNLSRLIGPAVAGSLIVWTSTGIVLAIGAATFAQFVVVLQLISVPPAAHHAGGGERNLLGEIVTGVRYAYGHHGIRYLLVLLGATGLLIRPCIELLPGFAGQVFERGAPGLALLMSSIGLGATISGLWVAQRGRTSGLTHLVTLSVLVMGLALVVFTVARPIELAAFFLGIVGFFMLLGGVSSQTLIQNAVDSAMRARIMSLFAVISWGLPALGALAMGWLASFLGLPHVIGVGAALAVLLWLFARPVGRSLAGGLEAGHVPQRVRE